MASGVKKPGAIKRITRFFRELKSEAKKIVWPTKKQTINNTLIVLIVMLVVGAFISVLDFGMSQLIMFIFSLAKGGS